MVKHRSDCELLKNKTISGTHGQATCGLSWVFWRKFICQNPQCHPDSYSSSWYLKTTEESVKWYRVQHGQNKHKTKTGLWNVKILMVYCTNRFPYSMMMLCEGNTFHITCHLWGGYTSPIIMGFPSQRVMQIFDVSYVVELNKLLVMIWDTRTLVSRHSNGKVNQSRRLYTVWQLLRKNFNNSFIITKTPYLTLMGKLPLMARFMEPTWGPSGADRSQVGPMLAPWTLLSGIYMGLLWLFWWKSTV